MTVELLAAQPAGRALLSGLLQLYTYDFSELEPPESRRFAIDEHGRLPEYPHLDSYWSSSERWPFLIRDDGATIGFVLVNQVSHRDDGFVERNMAEFFVMRQHRRRGVATDAVLRVFAALPGRWEIAVMERNTAALAFWKRVLERATVRELQQHEGDRVHWKGPIFSFVAG